MSDRVFSFDVFDTVLTRSILRPKDVFSLIQGRLCDVLPDVNPRLARSFRGARVWAEFCARRQVHREDVGLSDIYKIIEGWYALDCGKANILMDLEMKVEENALIANDGAAEHLAIRRKEVRVIFI